MCNHPGCAHHITHPCEKCGNIAGQPQLITCPKCQRIWEPGSEQAACISVYGKCIVCCVQEEIKNNFDWSIEEVLKEQRSLVWKN